MSEEVFSYIDDHAEEFVEDLKRLCRQPSVSAQDMGVGECANLLRDMMEESGVESRLLPVEGGYPVVFGELKLNGGGKTLGFYNHYDVQPPEPLELWHSPPFSAEEREGRIYARGVSDNKGNIVSRLKAVEAVRETMGEVPINLKFFVEGEEEIGSPHLLDFVNKNRGLLAADAYIWESGYKDPADRPEIRLGVKGILYVELRVKGAKSDLHSGKWAKLVVSPAWRLTWALNTLKDEKERVLIPGFYDDVKEPTDEEMVVLRKVPFEEERIKGELEIPELLGGKTGLEAIKTHIFEPSCNICGLDSGYKGPGVKTVLPKEAMAKVDMRLVEDQDPDDIFQKLKGHLRDRGFGDIELERMASYPAAKTPPEERIVQVAVRTAREVYGKEPVLTWSTGSSPIYTVKKNLNVPVVSAGVDYFYNYNHAPNENLRVREDFVQGIKHIAAIILAFGAE
ncbi:MAG: M20/M25/M40 family metallo-hydrolase [Candidatus Bathyarchaeia archaeon]